MKRQHHHIHRRGRRRRVITSIITAIVILIGYLIWQPQTISRVANLQPGLWYVTHDTDGDTIDVQRGSDKEIVRFIGMDTPETHDPRKPLQCYGPQAAAHTKTLLEHKYVQLVADPEDSDRDKYGRILRYVYLPNGELVNAELVRDGYAFAYVVFPFSKIDQFKALQSQAKAANVGLWKACNVDSSDIILQTAGSK